ncbi:MAG: hypothetical protein H7281_05730 [Bacteriovorax sp.]|nr:hypothetical protein [Bacteriovorax sp.]
MLKKTIFLTVALLLIAGGAGLFVIAPYHIYTLTLTEGVSTRFLVMKPSHPVFYDGQEFVFRKDLGSARDDSSLYANFHFSNFQMPLPFNHPIFSLIPIIKIESTGPRLGGSFFDGKSSELFSFMLEKTYKLETISGDQQLFLLPVFRNHISRKLEEDIWRDLFSKKLSLPSNVGKSFYESLLTLRKVTYNDLVYNLYILYNRTHLFPANTLRISFDKDSNHGLLELPSDDPKYLVERLFIIDKGVVYSMTIRTKVDNIAAEHARERILKESIYKSSTADSAIPIYAQYKNISYGHRIDQQGMTYLFAAWSHDLSNRDYVRVIILFLERGKSNLKFLKPFYEYAYKKFGSNLSSENDVLLETADEKLKRRMKEELEGEVKKEEQSSSNPKFEGNFSTPDEKIKFYLQKAKETKTNSDDSDKVLIQE